VGADIGWEMLSFVRITCFCSFPSKYWMRVNSRIYKFSTWVNSCRCIFQCGLTHVGRNWAQPNERSAIIIFCSPNTCYKKILLHTAIANPYTSTLALNYRYSIFNFLIAQKRNVQFYGFYEFLVLSTAFSRNRKWVFKYFWNHHVTKMLEIES